MKRTIQFFEVMEKTWISLAEKHKGYGPGFSEYAYKHATMYQRFAADSRASQSSMIEKEKEYNEWCVYRELYVIICSMLIIS